MGSCVIFCAGEFRELAEAIGDEDFVIAADGGLRHTERLGLQPDKILGDFDSLGYVPGEAMRFPVEKDDTDAMLAARLGLSLGYRRFVIYGGLDGPRLDHTIANFQTLLFLAEHGAVSYLPGLSYMATVLHREKAVFSSQCTGIFSLFCLGAPAADVTITGLQYPLNRAALTAGYPLGVSNHFLGRTATVAVGSGSLLALYDVNNPFPESREALTWAKN